MTGPIIVLRLTRGQQMALTSILSSYMVLADQPQDFVDVLEDRTTTTAELFDLVMNVREWDREQKPQ
jgi:hypothetical protein